MKIPKQIFGISTNWKLWLHYVILVAFTIWFLATVLWEKYNLSIGIDTLNTVVIYVGLVLSVGIIDALLHKFLEVD